MYKLPLAVDFTGRALDREEIVVEPLTLNVPVILVEARVDCPLTLIVVKVGVELTAMVEVPERLMLDPAVKKVAGLL